MAGGEGREGDWECGSCRNRNYAFRTFCNRCKQPRLLVDTKSPSDAKWLPRIGDWICPGCSNNNYASREKCKKCGQPKDEAAISAIAMQGASLPSYAHYLARIQGLLGLRINHGMMGNDAFQPSLSPFSSWSYGGVNKYGAQSDSSWPFGGINSGNSYGDSGSQILSTLKGWRTGDWICNCGFHNYSSRSQCKKCNAPFPTGAPSVPTSSTTDIFPALGTKRLASEEFLNDWDKKRLHAGDTSTYLLGSRQQLPYQGFDGISGMNQISGMYSKYLIRNSANVSGMPMRSQSPQHALTPSFLGKGVKQWRDGDWMCANCNNHNFASRSCCNRCKTDKEANVRPVSVSLV